MKAFLFVLSSIIAGTFVVPAAQAADRRIECKARGQSISQAGGLTHRAVADLEFVETTNLRGQRVLKNIEGEIRAYVNYFGPDNDDPVIYIGRFKIASLTENATYRPRRYVGYSQFKPFEAYDTTGSAESGMWGELVLEKSTRKRSIEAHYIFQAGSHMGGTLHMTCKVRRL